MRIFLSVTLLLLASNLAYSRGNGAALDEEREFFIFGRKQFQNTVPKDCLAPKKPSFHSKLTDIERRIFQSIYLTEVAKPILRTKRCDCNMLFPPYDHTVNIFNRDFAPMQLARTLSFESEAYLTNYSKEARVLYNKARDFCTTLGVR